MRLALWPSEQQEHADEIQRFFEGERILPAEVLIAFDEGGQAVGFAELSIRSVVEGCEPGGVGFLEGWFVAEGCRRKGVGAMLVRAAEEWARQQGCAEFGSDTEIENTVSIAAHKALGFEETERLVCFRKAL
jgi:aminoglycoside 6'-N-acetyltransferase I